MITKKFLCPSCKKQISCEGNPGDRIQIICSKCGQKGIATFKGEKTEAAVPETPTNVIEIKNLTKYYGKIKGIENLSFTVNKGEIFGFLGPNGAGKTTTIRTILGFLTPTSGNAFILGKNVDKNIVELKQSIGYIPGDFNLYGHLTGKRFLDYFSSLRSSDMSLRKELLEIFDIPLDRKIKGYSKGMKQKLSIVQAFMHNPQLVIMDEPTSGLDPLLQQKFYEFLKKEKEKGKTLFFSSHVLS